MKIKKLLMSFCWIASAMSASVHAGRSEPYDPSVAVKYARDWALARNSAYTSFSSDCTNFVSQALRTGGFRNTATTAVYGSQYWYYSTSSKYSNTWVNAHALYTRFDSGYENWVKWNGMESVNYGDIVFADWDADNKVDHSMIVTGFKKRSDGLLDPVFSYHSTDRLDFPRSSVYNLGGSSAKYYRFGPSGQCLVVTKNQIVP